MRVVIVGGGVAGLETMLAVRDLAGELVEIELLAREPRFWYRPMSTIEPFGEIETYSLELSMLSEVGAAVTLAAVTEVDSDAHRVRTSGGQEIEYDALVLAQGARPREALPGALTFRGPADVEAFGVLLRELEAGAARRIIFALPTRTVWSLPLYELALQTAAYASRRRVDVEVAVATHEQEPLELLGSSASDAVRTLLDQSAIAFHGGRHPVAFEHGQLTLVPTAAIAADRVVALPSLEGEPPAGVPHDRDGFVRTDRSGRVDGLDGNVYAAGDLTQFPIKHGGLATQQADTIAEEIAAHAGAALQRRSHRIVLHALLATGGQPLYIEADITSGRAHNTLASTEPLWWPPAKIAGRHLAPFLARHTLITRAPTASSAPEARAPAPASDEPPQTFEPDQLRAALAEAEKLVLALGAPEDLGGPPLIYLRELDQIIEGALSQDHTQRELRIRLAPIVHGLALFGLGALTVASDAADLTQGHALKMLKESVNGWLELHT